METFDVRESPAQREIIRLRVREQLQQRNLNGYVAFTPSNVTYLSGYVSYFLSNWWRMQGTAFVAMDAEGNRAPHLVLGDAEESSASSTVVGCEVFGYPMWVETRSYAAIQLPPDPEEKARPPQWREEDLDRALETVLSKLGLLSGRVGTDLRFITHSSFARLRRVAPEVEWVDVTDMMYQVRAVKQPFEVGRLRAAASLAEAGMTYAAETAKVGAALVDIRSYYHEGVAREVRTSARYSEFSDAWVICGLGHESSIAAHGQPSELTHGDLLKFDCGTTVEGYRSDSGRTFVMGKASAEAEKLYEDLLHAQSLAIEAIQPGAPASAPYFAASEYMHKSGYPSYRRGHFGHSLGLDTFHEEPPFLAPDDQTSLLAGMVLAVETPFYGSDLGPIMIEDLVLVTEAGPELITRLPRTLVSLRPDI